MKFDIIAILLPAFLAFSSVMTTVLSFYFVRSKKKKKVNYFYETRHNVIVQVDDELVRYVKSLADQKKVSNELFGMTENEAAIFRNSVKLTH